MRIRNVVPLFMIPLLVTAGPGTGQPRDAPPSTPQGLVAQPYGPGAGEIRWQRSTDDLGAVIGYEIARDGVVLGVFDTLSRVDRDLESGNVHRFSVTAIDSAGQRSGTARVMLSTHDALPLMPSGYRGEIYSTTTVELSWNRPAPPFIRYEVRRDGRTIATTDGTSHIDSTLASGRRYLFEVIALNRQDRRSAPARLWVHTGQGTTSPDAAVIAPGRVEATASLEPIDAVRILEPMPTELSITTQGSGPEALVGVDGHGDDISVRLLYSAYVEDEGVVFELVEFAPVIGSSTTLAAWPPGNRIAISANADAVALTDDCLASVQLIGAMSTPMPLGEPIFEVGCADRPRISPDGDVAVFAVGPDEGDVIYVPADGTAISTRQGSQPLGDPELDAMRRSMTLLDTSDDGHRLLFHGLFTDNSQPMAVRAHRDYTVATLLLDTSTGSIELISRNDYRGPKPRAPYRGSDASTISGDGRIAYYLQLQGRVTVGAAAPSADRSPTVMRLEIESGVRSAIALEGTKRFLATDGDGGILAFMHGLRADLPTYLDREEHVLVYDVERNELVDLGDAARFCDGDDCLLERFQFSPQPPLASADGTTLVFEGIAHLANGERAFAREGARLLIYDTVERELHWPLLPSLRATNPPHGIVTNDDGSVVTLLTRAESVDDDEKDVVTVRLLER